MISKTKKITALIAASLCATSCYLLHGHRPIIKEIKFDQSAHFINAIKSQLVLAAIYGNTHTQSREITKDIKNMVKQDGKITITPSEYETRIYILNPNGSIEMVIVPSRTTKTFDFPQISSTEDLQVTHEKIKTLFKSENKAKLIAQYTQNAEMLSNEINKLSTQERNLHNQIQENPELKSLREELNRLSKSIVPAEMKIRNQHNKKIKDLEERIAQKYQQLYAPINDKIQKISQEKNSLFSKLWDAKIIIQGLKGEPVFMAIPQIVH